MFYKALTALFQTRQKTADILVLDPTSAGEAPYRIDDRHLAIRFQKAVGNAIHAMDLRVEMILLPSLEYYIRRGERHTCNTCDATFSVEGDALIITHFDRSWPQIEVSREAFLGFLAENREAILSQIISCGVGAEIHTNFVRIAGRSDLIAEFYDLIEDYPAARKAVNEAGGETACAEQFVAICCRNQTWDFISSAALRGDRHTAILQGDHWQLARMIEKRDLRLAFEMSNILSAKEMEAEFSTGEAPR
jgi:hypothetical protein